MNSSCNMQCSALDANENHVFQYVPAGLKLTFTGLKLTFILKDNKMILNQGGGELEFIRKEQMI
jgi:hypothetical protein